MLRKNRKPDGSWDLGKEANDKIWFPLSDDWRRKENRTADCTVRIERLLALLQQERNA